MKPVIKQGLNWVVWTLSFVLLIIAEYYHHPWRDEAQAVMLVQDSTSWSDLLHRIRWEGHPILWFAIIKIFGTSMVPWIHVAIASCTNFLIIHKSKWPRLLAWTLPFTYFFFFEFGVVFRNYAIGILALFIAAHFWKNKPNTTIAFLILAALSNVFAAVIAVFLGLKLFAETRSRRLWYWWAPVVIIIATTTIIGLIPPESGGFASGMTVDYNSVIHSLSQATISLGVPFEWLHPYSNPLLILPLILILLTLGFLLGKKNRLIFWAIALSIITACTVLVDGYPRHYLHILIAFLVLAFIERTSFQQTKFLKYLGFVLIIPVNIYCAFIYSILDSDSPIPFSHAQNVGEHLISAEIPSERVAVYPDNFGAAISYATDDPYYLPLTDTVMTHIIWNAKSQETIYAKELKRRLEAHFKEGKYYLISPYYIPGMHEDYFNEPVRYIEWDDALTDEKFFLFEFEVEE